MTVPLDAQLAVGADVLTRQVDGELVLLNQRTEHYFGLDSVGAAIWDAVARNGSITAAHPELALRYEVDPATLTYDMEQLVARLLDEGLLTLRDR